MLCTSGFVDGVMFSHNGQALAIRIRRILRLTTGTTGGVFDIYEYLVHCLVIILYKAKGRVVASAKAPSRRFLPLYLTIEKPFVF